MQGLKYIFFLGCFLICPWLVAKPAFIPLEKQIEMNAESLKRRHEFEGDDMCQLLPYIDADTLVVLDLDNTLMCSKTQLGSVQWFCQMIGESVQEGLSLEEAHEKHYPKWMAVQERTDVRFCHSSTERFLAALENKGIRVLALTCRKPIMSKSTLEQLSRLNIDFSKHVFSKENVQFSFKHAVSFEKGVIFSGEYNDKGKVLVSFLEQVEEKPSRVIFVDDKQKHLKAVWSALDAQGVDCVAMRYSREDARVLEYDVELAQKQYEILTGILSDRDTKTLLEKTDARLHVRQEHISEKESQNTDGEEKLKEVENRLVVIDSFEACLQEIDENSLVFWNLDHSFLSPSQALGSLSWAQDAFQAYQEQGLSKKEALDQLFPKWMAVLSRSRAQEIDPALILFLEKVRKKSAQFFPYTLRDSRLAFLTHQSLQEKKINLSVKGLQDVESLFKENDIQLFSGVIFSSLTPLHEILSPILEKANSSHKKWIHIGKVDPLSLEKISLDPEEKHLLLSLDKKFSLDAGDKDLARLQEFYLSRIIPDELAQVLLEDSWKNEI